MFFNPESSGSEGAVHRALMEEVARHKGKRVVVTTFRQQCSARLQTLGEGRAVKPGGRSASQAAPL